MRIMPLAQIEFKKQTATSLLKNFSSSNDKFLYDILKTDNYIFTESGKHSIRIIMEYLKIKKEDEVFITTTTESSYVSTCVSATIFNYAKISRVLTDKTKIVYVIHNFSFPHPKLLELREYCNNLGIVLIEDCAFSFDSYDDTLRLGSIGDFSIYSLPKIFPIRYGGVLSFRKNSLFNYKKSIINIEKSIEKWIPKLKDFTKIRQRNYMYLYNNIFEKKLYGPIHNQNPFMFGISTLRYKELFSSSKDEFGLTHVKNEFHIPVNPFIIEKDYINIIRKINND